MDRHPKARRITAAIALATIAACSSSTVIHTNTPGAKVFIDGEYVGTTPYTMTDRKIVGSSTRVRIESPGFEPVRATISRTEQLSAGACITVFLLVPALWIMEYAPEHYFEMRPTVELGPGAPPPSPPGPTAPAGARR